MYSRLVSSESDYCEESIDYSFLFKVRIKFVVSINWCYQSVRRKMNGSKRETYLIVARIGMGVIIESMPS